MRSVEQDRGDGSTASEERENAEIVALKNGCASTVVLIEKRALIRDCLSRCISADFGAPVMSFPTIDSLEEASAGLQPALIIVSACEGSNDRIEAALHRLSRADYRAPIVVLSDAEDIDEVAGALRSGASGHVPTGTAFDVAVEAMRLVIAGGIFVPGDVLLKARRQNRTTDSNARQVSFTARQNAVLDALRQGKTNKLIAYELNMSESTVKVHVRNIMRKLDARNRTEVAVRAGDFLARRRPNENRGADLGAAGREMP
jgi:DNA-binding NarL/FixJ family response regulator